MNRLLRAAWLVLLGCVALFTLVMIFGPREPVQPEVSFDRSLLRDGIDTYFALQEGRFPDIKPGLEKRVVWRGLEEVPTDLAIVYVHGFSASLQEMRPLPDLVAETLDANLVFTRLRGHARDSAALGQARASHWREDLNEALAVARQVGREVVIMASSTGASVVVAAAADDPEAMEQVKGLVLISPNFGVTDPKAALLHLPAGRYWVPWFAGRQWGFEPQNVRHAQFWTPEYPSTALFSMAAISRAAARADHDKIGQPALFYYSEDDQIVDGTRTTNVAERWGGPVTQAAPALGEGMDPNAHIIAGDILSPAGTVPAAALIVDWIRGL
ncbi:MAG: alpha/beta fold hydrolase [Pseudomonadota bacterium]